ncbi:hypothetical protein MTR67_023037 [Solanum verrucosum]|uniref:Uncharacterized protein n=1 Tax=Solanum verrucosum TaxID=315347 RepID=A0AAF0QST2_SOLVR|nr:hypothetical protein MTR67_023037 [Solanum verrucosum]
MTPTRTPLRILDETQEAALLAAKRSIIHETKDHEAWTYSRPVDGNHESSFSLLKGPPKPHIPSPFNGCAVRSVNQLTLRAKVSTNKKVKVKVQAPSSSLQFLGKASIKTSNLKEKKVNAISCIETPHFQLPIYPAKWYRPIQVIAFMDTGAATSMLNPTVLPKEQCIPHFQYFNKAS